MFGVEPGERCTKLEVKSSTEYHWITGSDKYYADIMDAYIPHPSGIPLSCSSLEDICKGELDQNCFEDDHKLAPGQRVNFHELEKFQKKCLGQCKHFSWVHGSMIFNAFVFCQVFNEYNSKNIHSDWNIFSGMLNNPLFFLVTLITVGLQVMLIEAAGPFMKTSPLTLNQWGVTIGLGALSFPIGILMRFIPVEEDPESFFDNTAEIKKAAASMKNKSPLEVDRTV